MTLPQRLSRLLPFAVVLAVAAVAASSARLLSRPAAAPRAELVETVALKSAVEKLNAAFVAKWKDAEVEPAKPAPDLQILRRLSLALHGTIPALEEIREFEADTRPDRLERWTRRMLADLRFADYFAERLARGFVGKEAGQFVVFRRDRFVEWLREQLRKNTPYDEVVRTMISETGLWTGKPATNFVTAAVNEGDVDENKLAGKTVRAFLGQRIDCAQCHDHPFEHWKQHEYEGLAAFYGQVQPSLLGIQDHPMSDGRPVVYEVEDRKTLAKRVVDEGVPFHRDWLPAEGSRRERLGAWITHAENRRFERAIANRAWALLFGRALHEPVDDLPDPPEGGGDVLDILGRDFREHGCDLRRLIEVIAASASFRADSEYEFPASEKGSFGEDLALVKRAEDERAVFALVRLRPEQVVGSILQSMSLQTADQNSHLLFRTIRLLRGGQFVNEYGDLGENELQDRGGTIPQRLLLMNGDMAGDAAKAGFLSSAGRIAALASTDEKCVETAYLVCLTRRPTAEESAPFVEQLRGKKGEERRQTVEDLIWSLLNSTEFSWNH